MSKDIFFFFFFDLLKGHIGIHNYKSRFSQTPILAVFTPPPLNLVPDPQKLGARVRVLARNFKTCVRDSLLGIIWRPRMKNMRTGIRI